MSMTASALAKFGMADPFQAGMAVTVVELAFLRIAQHLVGLGGFLELGLRLGIADVAIRMILHGQLAIGLFERVVVGVSRDAQNLVIVPLAGHSSA